MHDRHHRMAVSLNSLYVHAHKSMDHTTKTCWLKCSQQPLLQSCIIALPERYAKVTKLNWPIRIQNGRCRGFTKIRPRLRTKQLPILPKYGKADAGNMNNDTTDEGFHG